MAIKIEELKKAIQSTSNELDKLQNHLFDQMQFDEQSIIGFNRHDKGIVIKIHLGKIQISIAFDYCSGMNYKSGNHTYKFNSPYCSIADIRFYSIDDEDITDKVNELIGSIGCYESRNVLDMLIKVNRLTISNDGVIEYE